MNAAVEYEIIEIKLSTLMPLGTTDEVDAKEAEFQSILAAIEAYVPTILPPDWEADISSS